jgi:hypothetical protein
MDKFPESHDPLDDKLSEFTDRLLSSGDEIKAQETMNDDGLSELQRTAIHMKAAARMARPSSAVSARVRTRLLKEWKQQQAAQSKFQTFKAFFRPLPRFAMAGSLAALLLLSIVTFAVPAGTPLTGAAIKLQAWTPLFVFLGLILVGFLIWFDRRK